jgi:holin-like protein
MKYLKELAIILLFSLGGEVCHALIPLPIPASIYGMVLLLAAFLLKLLKVEKVEKTGNFLVSLFPLLFVAPAVGLVAHWELLRDNLWQIAIVVVVSTVLTFGCSGMLTKLLRKGGDGNG